MSTNLNGFSVNIQSDSVTHFQKGEYNYYALPHLNKYKIKLTNNRPSKCDAEVSIDGEIVGTWRVKAFSSTVIERPANLNREFIFVEEKSNIAEEAGIQDGDNSNGLITVIFKPEKINSYDSIRHCSTDKYFLSPSIYNGNESCNNWCTTSNESYPHSNKSQQCMSYDSFANDSSFNSGATILGAGTDQYFNTAKRLTCIDTNNITTINLRLVTQNNPYVSVKNAMRGKSTSIPPRFESNVGYHFMDRMCNNDRRSTLGNSQWATFDGL